MRHLKTTASAAVLALLLGAGVAGAQTSEPSPPARQDATGRHDAALERNREQIVAAIRNADIRETGIDSGQLRVGSVLPPTVDLSPLPDRVAQLAPGLRGHSVVRARDRLFFVDNRSRRVADVLQLSAAEQQAMGGADRQQARSGQPRADGTPQNPAVAAVAIVFIQLQQREQWLTSRLMDRTVYNLQNESIGDVEDILIGPDGRVQALLLGVGGFLGLGEKTIAVPFDRFELLPTAGVWGDRDTRLVLRTNRDDLTNAPAFRGLDATSAARTTDRNEAGDRAGARNQPSTPAAPAR